MSIPVAEADTVQDLLEDEPVSPRTNHSAADADTVADDLSQAEGPELPRRPSTWADLESPQDFPSRPPGHPRLTRYRGKNGEVVVKAVGDRDGVQLRRWQAWETRWQVAGGAGLLQLFRTTHEQGVSFLEMPYFPAGSLFDHFHLDAPARYMPPSAEDLLQIVRRMTDALDALQHVSGADLIVHRDIKPSNIMVRAEPFDVVLADPDWIAVGAAADHSADLRGTTAAYTAPECQPGDVHAEGDYWSLGMTLVHVGTGHHPLEGRPGRLQADRTIRSRVRWENLRLPNGLDPRVHHLARGLLLVDRLDRFGSDELREWLAGDMPTLSSPDVDPTSSQSGTRPQAEPDPRTFEFDGRVFDHVSDLAAAFQDAWVAGIQVITGRRQQALLDWVGIVDRELADPLLTIMETQASGGSDGDHALAAAIRLFSPAAAPVFRGFRVDRWGLESLVDRAVDNSQTELDLLFRLGQSGALDVIATGPATPGLAQVASRWRDLISHADDLARRFVPDAVLVSDRRVNALILGSQLSDARARGLAETSGRARTERACEAGWFNALCQPVAPEMAPANQALALEAAALAEAYLPPVRPEIDAWARAYIAQHVAGEGQGAIRDAGSGHRSAHWLHGQGLPFGMAIGLVLLLGVHSLDRLSPGLIAFLIATLTGVTTSWLLAAVVPRTRAGHLGVFLAIAGVAGTLLGATVLLLAPDAVAVAWWLWGGLQLVACWLVLLPPSSVRNRMARSQYTRGA